MPENSTKRLKVFLCHAPEDIAAANQIYQRLRKSPWIDAWFAGDRLISGQNRTRATRQAIDNADVVIVFLSKSSTSTEGYVQRELRAVMDRELDMPEGRIFIIPIRLDRFEALPYDLESRVAIDFLPNSDKKKAYDSLTASLRVAAESIAVRSTSAVPRARSKPKKTKAPATAELKIPASKKTTHAGHPVYVFGKMEFVRVPSGSFRMGSSIMNPLAYPDERPQLDELIPYDYYIGRYPVTIAQYVTFVEWNQYQHEWVDDLVKKHNHPVTCITFQAAGDFCKWLTQIYKKDLPPDMVFRLPLEVEWEKAARGEEGFEWPWGNDFDSKKCNSRENGKLGTSPVGEYSSRGGDSPYGAADMAGNVWEWTTTLFKKYPYSSDDGRESQESAQTCVVRGGSFYDAYKYIRSAYRYMNPAPILYYFQGLRVVVGPTVKSVVSNCPPHPIL